MSKITYDPKLDLNSLTIVSQVVNLKLQAVRNLYVQFQNRENVKFIYTFQTDDPDEFNGMKELAILNWVFEVNKALQDIPQLKQDVCLDFENDTLEVKNEKPIASNRGRKTKSKGSGKAV